MDRSEETTRESFIHPSPEEAAQRRHETEIGAPSVDYFLSAPAAKVAEVAPRTMVLAPGGTRREAALAGISSESDEYPRWSLARMFECVDQLFQLGVQHVFLNAVRTSPMAEVGRFRTRLLQWAEQGMSGPPSMDGYARRGWRARLVGVEDLPELHAARERLREGTPARWERTLWFFVSATPESHWSAVLDAARRTQAHTRADVVRALYGEDVPLATLCLGWGKPMMAADIAPLILADEMQCYWTQRPGFGQGERTLRHIFYDYAYTRRTWMKHKASRYADVPAQRELWERPCVLDVGQREGAFWYPRHDNLCGGLHALPTPEGTL